MHQITTFTFSMFYHSRYLFFTDVFRKYSACDVNIDHVADEFRHQSEYPDADPNAAADEPEYCYFYGRRKAIQ